MSRWIKNSLWGLLCIPVVLAVLGALKFYAPTSETEENRLIRELQKAYATRMYEQANLQCTMIGTGGTKGLDELSFYFRSPKQINRDEISQARKIALNCSETLLKMVNSNKDLKPYLVHYPFTHRNIDVTVFFVSDKNNLVDDRPFWAVTVDEQGVAYEVDSDIQHRRIIVKSEPYSEAIRLAKLEDTSL
jgi:hypothetical protein